MRVVQIRPTDIYMSLGSRPAKANSAKVDVYICNHHNSYHLVAANGLETYYHPNKPQDKKYAQILHNELWATGLFKSNRGVKTANFQVLRDAKVPAVLPEMGFISNKDDRDVIVNKWKLLAAAEARAIQKMNVDSVAIGAGHGGSDPGAVSKWHKRKDYALKISLEVERILNEANKPTFKSYKKDIPKGTILYDKNGKAYELPTGSNRTVTILGEHNGMGLIREKWLVGVNEAYVKLFKPYKFNIKKGEFFYDKKGNVYAIPSGKDRTVTILEEYNGLGLIRENFLVGVTEAWVKLFRPYAHTIKVGTTLYDANGKAYSLKNGRVRNVTIVEVKNGFGRFVDKTLIGVDEAWVKVV